jgi:hypothetical protein
LGDSDCTIFETIKSERSQPGRFASGGEKSTPLSKNQVFLNEPNTKVDGARGRADDAAA